MIVSKLVICINIKTGKMSNFLLDCNDIFDMTFLFVTALRQTNWRSLNLLKRFPVTLHGTMQVQKMDGWMDGPFLQQKDWIFGYASVKLWCWPLVCTWKTPPWLTVRSLTWQASCSQGGLIEVCVLSGPANDDEGAGEVVCPLRLRNSTT